MATAQAQSAPFFPGDQLGLDLLAADPRPAGFTLTELSGADAGGSRWSLGPELAIDLPALAHDLELRVRLHDPGFRQNVSVLVGGRPAAEVNLGPGLPHANLRIALPTASGPVSVRLRPDQWNEASRLAPGDLRPIALNLGELRALHAALAKGKLCPMPFTRKEVKGGGPFVPCCSPWLTQEYFALPTGEDAWNGEQARALRASVMDGSYRYCLREICQTSYAALDDFEWLGESGGEFVVTPANFTALREGSTRLPEGPTAATVTADPRCNLVCGSCRSEAVLRLDAAGELRVERARAELVAMAGSLRRLRIAGDGEPLFSPFLRELIQSLDRKQFPALEIVELHTNGLFLEEKVLESLKPGSGRINRVYVSIDAGDQETYRRVRGGDWERLLRNLRWAAAQRKAGRFQALLLLFVYRAENFRSMAPFAALGRELGVDGMHFSPLQDWERAGLPSYEKMAVHLATHPEHRHFLAARDELRRVPGVTIS